VSTNDVAKNTLYLTLASVGQKVLSFVYFLFVARVMKPEATGGYFLALSIVTVALSVSDFGINSVIIREVAKDPGDVNLVRRALALKIPTTLLAILFANVAAMLLGYSPQVRLLVALACVVLTLDTFTQFFYGVLRGLRSLSYEAIGLCAGQTVTLVVGLSVLYFNPSLPMLIVALMAGSLFNLSYSAWTCAKRVGTKMFAPKFDRASAKAIFAQALPFLLAALFVKAYGNIDAQFLNYYLGTSAVGVYSIAYKYTYAFQFLPLAFVAALYPGMSARVKEPAELARLYDRAMWYMLLLAVPIAFGLWGVAPDAVALVGSDYAAAAPVLATLCFALIPAFLDFPNGSLLNASGKQGTKTAIFGATMVLNVVLDWLLIPNLGMLGAAYASIVSLSFLAVTGIAFVSRELKQHGRHAWFSPGVRILVSGAAMAFAVREVERAFSGKAGLVIAVAAGAAVYAVGLVLTRAVTRTDAAQAFALIRRKQYVDQAAAPDA
jgi:O-antigen/teichoic acid export membrane protein